MKVTPAGLIERLDGIRGAKMVTIFADTPQRDKLRKTLDGRPCPFLSAHRHVILNGTINWSYENAVDRQRLREAQPQNAEGYVLKFEPMPRSWGQRLKRPDGTLRPWVEHKGTYYLEMKPGRYLFDKFFAGDGTEIDRADIEPWFYKKDEGERQGVDNVIRVRDYKLDNIRSVTVDNEMLELR